MKNNNTVREMLFEREKEYLSPFAVLSENTEGREIEIEPCTLRTDFQRDRDRITHSKAFRRLMHKTQVFLSPEEDHYRTRLTHTLEVSQIGRTIARALRLNEDLTEAIALGHDLGHTPFGHAGERMLNACCSTGFCHNEQSLRVVEVLENLNLTKEVRDGILSHVWTRTPKTLEGKIIQFADRIAYINHDIDDAIRGGIMKNSDIPDSISSVLSETYSGRINSMVTSIIRASEGINDIVMDDKTFKATNELHRLMFDLVYCNPIAKGEEGKAQEMLRKMYDYYTANPDEIPEEYRLIALRDGADRAVCDFIAGMTDRYAINKYKELFIPSNWDVKN
ncbi:MAG: deoxyguanosinetriphosphate triphosphohydrolase [Clostridia bacterium]|nr:deoxyguanosinetriphosphate triphosphohydrolase [Clostridia bacterium]